jgi:hypothetical protein
MKVRRLSYAWPSQADHNRPPTPSRGSNLPGLEGKPRVKSNAIPPQPRSRSPPNYRFRTCLRASLQHQQCRISRPERWLAASQGSLLHDKEDSPVEVHVYQGDSEIRERPPGASNRGSISVWMDREVSPLKQDDSAEAWPSCFGVRQKRQLGKCARPNGQRRRRYGYREQNPCGGDPEPRSWVGGLGTCDLHPDDATVNCRRPLITIESTSLPRTGSILVARLTASSRGGLHQSIFLGS